MRIFILFALFCTQITSTLSAQKVVQYINGQVFDGRTFAARTFWSVDNKITFKDPKAATATTFDTEGRFIVPAYGDAVAMGYCDYNDPEYYLKQYQNEGIQYLTAIGHSAAFEERARGFISAKTPDVRFANGTITAPGGYPASVWDELVERRKQNMSLAGVKGPNGIGDNYWVIGGAGAFGSEWERILLQRPEAICAFMPDASSMGGKKVGMDGKTLKAIAKAAKKAKIQLILVTRSKSDFLQAIALKPHIIVGVPYLETLTEKEIKSVIKSKAFVAPCFFSSMRELAADPAALAAAGGLSQMQIVERQGLMFKQMLAAKVPFVLGSGDPSRSTTPEINQWVQFGITDYTSILEIICNNTPRCIYPDRKLGKIAEGYEANFLMLSASPLDNIQKARLIGKAVKGGVLLEEASFNK
jgi:imidazolonepropionase-like amidohydrolase